ncbi:MAG TPA: indole-3-glycerol-phosphate synthase [Spirochaetota bacterium]|nr:indole-3-glycerol-phosphate synthase [Spirochaetota bacterium]HPR36308.1 indole-3-glycerol-phosphate synthase [Spirochaetota bacterium]HRX46753.1 indole-3-glycerol-phosphate synthase [Spirochaetota bacterium]
MRKFSLDAMRNVKERELSEMTGLSLTLKRERPVYKLKDSFGERINIIAELKHSSPSHGFMDSHITDSVRLARYVYGGASAVSILAEREFFGGSYDIMKLEAEKVSVPVLCKDFVFFKEQIDAAYVCGADMVLLIAKGLEKNELQGLYRHTESLGILPLVEVCREDELEKLGGIAPEFIMVNMRDLETLDIDFRRGIKTLNALPENVTAISASGINSRNDIEFIMREAGVKNFLVGASLMTHSEPDMIIRELKNVC